MWNFNHISVVAILIISCQTAFRACFNEHHGVSNHQPHNCLLNGLFRPRSNETSKTRVTGLCEGNSPGTGEFPAQSASNAENVSIWWRHHEVSMREDVTHATHALSKWLRLRTATEIIWTRGLNRWEVDVVSGIRLVPPRTKPLLE